MDLSWGIDLWDRLDHIINHSNSTSSLIDKIYKCFIDCHHIWKKAAHKQKRLLQKLQSEIKESSLDEFTLTSSLLSLINNLTSICNIKSTFQDSIAKASDDHLKKTHSQIKKQTSSWSTEKRRMEDDLCRDRRKYDLALKRYRDKYQAMMLSEENLKKCEENRALSRTQVDMCQNIVFLKHNEYDDSKRDYAVELTNFNTLQQTHFSTSVVDWAKEGEKLYKQRLSLLKSISNEFAKFTKEMVKNLSYSVTRFSDIAEGVSFEKDAILLVQKYKTGDVPPVELQFINLDNKQYSSKPQRSIYDNANGVEESSGSGSSTSSFESNVGVTNESVYSGSYSSMKVATGTRSELGPQSVHDVKLRNSTKLINPEARFSFRKSGKIFRSAAPWKSTNNQEKPTTDKAKSVYQRRGRSSVRDAQPQQRSHSVSEMISNALRSSFHRKSIDATDAKAKQKQVSPQTVHKTSAQQESSDFDTDSSYEQCHNDKNHVTTKVVSTPAEAVGLAQRNNSVTNFCSTEPVQVPNETNGDGNCEFSYVGSCVSCHDFDSQDPSNRYISFKAGDQFYIVTMDEGSGWLLVETVDQNTRGYVPTSYMEIQPYDRFSEDVI